MVVFLFWVRTTEAGIAGPISHSDSELCTKQMYIAERAKKTVEQWPNVGEALAIAHILDPTLRWPPGAYHQPLARDCTTVYTDNSVPVYTQHFQLQ